MKTLRAFVLATAERATKTAAQTALVVIGADHFNALHADYSTIGGLALGAAVVSVLTSVASAGIGNAGPSLATEVTEPPAKG